ncbi:hypothetical protein CC80DRAFT_460886 [Byssothecium circinans]|uniref:Uncharacterized protein n=1 Tax=Byssothecium circinans TaxID=147558 RepID=A0A6A5UBS6_9PLEO|nr:hypothetical protein CC80DRAFT_460886 [Byssothecium circinans]
MKAAQFFGQNDVRFVSVPNPKSKDHESLVAIEWCGICGSDLHKHLIGPMTCPPKERPHAITSRSILMALGPELCGRVVSALVGSNLSSSQAVIDFPST